MNIVCGIFVRHSAAHYIDSVLCSFVSISSGEKKSVCFVWFSFVSVPSEEKIFLYCGETMGQFGSGHAILEQIGMYRGFGVGLGEFMSCILVNFCLLFFYTVLTDQQRN